MKILIVTQYFWPENFRINDLALRLKERGHEITVFTGIPNYPSGKIFPGWGPFKRLNDEWEGITIKRFPHFPRGKRKALGMAANFISFALLGSLFIPFRIKDQYDVIFVYEPSPVTVGIPAIVLKKLRNTPIVFWVHDLWPQTFETVSGIKNSLIKKGVRKISRFVHCASDRVLVTSKFFIPPIEKQGVEKERIFYYPQSAEGFYRPLEKRPADKEEILPQGFRITFAGNIGVSQSIDTIVKAASYTTSTPEIKWIIVGDGREMENVRSLIQKNGLSQTVFLLGRKPAKEMPEIFALSDVLLLTLRKDPVFSLTVPSKLQSYMACRKPILAAIDGETAEIISEANAGLCVAAEDAKALARAALKMYLASADERAEWGANAHRYFKENFDPDVAVESLEKHFSRTMDTSVIKG